MRVAVYGGSFDPITDAHLSVAAEVLHFQLADEVWIVPCGDRPDKATQASSITRLWHCRLAVQSAFPESFPVRVVSTEVDNGVFIPTVYLLRQYRRDFPGFEFSMVIGTDLVPGLLGWDEGESLIKETEFIVVPRCDVHGLLFRSEDPKGFRAQKLNVSRDGFHAAVSNISSTEVRQRLSEKGIVGALGMVPLSVLQDIEKEGLYGVVKSGDS